MGRKVNPPNLLNAIPNDKTGQYLKWGIMGVVGLYLLKMHRKMGGIGNVPGNYRVNIDTDKMVDMIGGHVGLNPERSALAKEALREFKGGFQKARMKHEKKKT